MAGSRSVKLEGRRALAVPLTLLLLGAGAALSQERPQPNFVTSDQCIVCHSNMADASGETLSIGHTWRASLMAQSAKDPYWQAAVEREIVDRPQLQAEIEDTCSVCHMPMYRTQAIAGGGSGEILRYLAGGFTPQEHAKGADGVSCTVCHQISAENLGDHASFDGGYVIEKSLPEQTRAYGPHAIDPGLESVMQSASAVLPRQGGHVQSSELCATCHTLFTPALDAGGEVIGEFPEQVPYLEWKHSGYLNAQSCQDCHMPEVEVPVPIASVLGEPRDNVSRHVFRGGNVFMLRLLNRYRDELGVTAPAAELEESARATLEHLQSSAARLEIIGLTVTASEAVIDLGVTNLAGHKLPTAYPSRRAWLHVTARDQDGRAIFESGALAPDGSIAGNDNDADPRAYEPHYDEIISSDQVQIYEPIIQDHDGRVTTSLLSGVTYAKDNRLLPLGFDKSTAEDAIRVLGGAHGDSDFRDGGDAIRYRVRLPDGVSSVVVEAELLYQTIGHRWAENLERYDSEAPRRFVGYFRAHAEESAIILAETRAEARPDQDTR